MPDVFAHGMLSMAYLGRMLTDWQPQASLRGFSNRFAAITQLHDAIACSGWVTALLEQGGETLAQCEIQAVKANGSKPWLARRWSRCNAAANWRGISPSSGSQVQSPGGTP